MASQRVHRFRPPGSQCSGEAAAIDGDGQCRAHPAHALVAEAAEAVHQGGHGDTLDRVEVHNGSSWDRVLVYFEHDLAGQSANRGRAWGHQGPSQSRDGRVPREDDDGAPPDLRQFAPPHLTTCRERGHDRDAASRNEARSPHSSGSSTGWSSYARYEASISALRCSRTSAERASSRSAASFVPARARRALSRSSPSTVVLTRTLAMPQVWHRYATISIGFPPHPDLT